MKFFVLIVLMLVAFSALISAIPSQQDVLPGYSMLVEEPEVGIQNEKEVLVGGSETGRADRFRRATCDLLSFTTKLGSINHAACAAHCLAMRKGFRGGRCRDGVCHCRR